VPYITATSIPGRGQASPASAVVTLDGTSGNL